MKTERISYSESVESANEWGLKSWKKFSVDILMEEGDSDEDGRKKAVQIVRDGLGEIGSVIKVNPEYQHLLNGTSENNPSIIPESTPPIKVTKEDKIQSFIQTIQMCTNLKFLKNFETRVKEYNDEELTQAYQQKLKEFN